MTCMFEYDSQIALDAGEIEDNVLTVRFPSSAVLYLRHRASTPDVYPVYEDFGREYFGNLFARGQKQGKFKPGDPKQYGEIFWNYLTGYMTNMKIKEGKHYQPDIDAVLKLFEF